MPVRTDARRLVVGIAGNQPPTAKAALKSFGLEARLITTSAELGVDKPSLDFFRKTLAKTLRDV